MRSLTPLLVSSVLLAGAASCSDASSAAPANFASLPVLDDYPRAGTDAPRKRVWRDAPFTRDLTLGTGGHTLGQPLSVRVSPDGNLFVLDFGETQIKEYAPDGRLVRRYGAGKGRGPGEFLSLTDISVPSSDEVWGLDPSGGRIVVFDRQARPVRHVPLPVPTTRMQAREDGSFVLLSLNGYLFAEYDSLGRRTGESGHILPEQGTRGIVLQGEFVETADGIVYAPMRAGYLARFTPEGDLAFYVETVDRQDYPSVERQPNGALMVGKPRRLAIRSIAVSGDDILVLAPLRDRDPAGWVVDVYALADGAYRYSFLPPDPVERISAAGRDLFIVGDTVVSRWNR